MFHQKKLIGKKLKSIVRVALNVLFLRMFQKIIQIVESKFSFTDSKQRRN